MQKEYVDAVIVGAGPAGISAAITLAKAGKEVVVIERGDFPGSKNVFGGAIYTHPTSEIFPDFWKTAPIERENREHKFLLLGNDDATTISYQFDSKNTPCNSYTVERGKWDKWCALEAEKAGAYIINQTLVTGLIKDGNQIIGIKTEQEDFYAKITIIADGVNSLLAKEIGLHKNYKPEQVALGVKEVIKLSPQTIEQRFNTQKNTGVIHTILGGPLKAMMGLGFIYTNKSSVVIGIGVSLEELQKRKLKPYELLNNIKKHSIIEPLIKDGEILEYSAHLIPEGGYASIPKLYTNGAMIVGDAAMLINNVHWEGTNIAMISGKLAAQTAIEAIDKNDFSAKSLSSYKKRLENNFVLKDMKSYRNVIKFIDKNSEAFLGFYPQKINEFFNLFLNVDSIPKREKYISFLKKIIKEKSPLKILCDMIKFAKLGVGILLK